MNNLNVAKIQLNGKPFDLRNETNLKKLFKDLKISENKVAIEINGIIIEKNKYSQVVLNKDDKVEIVHFIGGG